MLFLVERTKHGARSRFLVPKLISRGYNLEISQITPLIMLVVIQAIIQLIRIKPMTSFDSLDLGDYYAPHSFLAEGITAIHCALAKYYPAGS